MMSSSLPEEEPPPPHREEEDEEDNDDDVGDGDPPKKSPPSRNLRLPLGTFADGQSIFRNQLQRHVMPKSSSRSKNDETFRNGHVHISHLVLPECSSALLTTFVSPEFEWLESWLGDDVPNVLLVQSSTTTESSSLPDATNTSSSSNKPPTEIGHGILLPLPLPPATAAAKVDDNHDSSDDDDDDDDDGSNESNKQDTTSAAAASSSAPSTSRTSKRNERSLKQLFVKPHTGLQHAKLCLFRNPQGLRVVICGSNLYQDQWECQRDVSWVQDFFNTSSNSNNSSSSSSNRFGATLHEFCKDLTTCAADDDQDEVDDRLSAILGFDNQQMMDFSTAAATLVYSFPRRQPGGRKNGNNNDLDCRRGGWKMLAQAVQDQCKLVQRQRDARMQGTLTGLVQRLRDRHDHGGSGGRRKRKRQQEESPTSSSCTTTTNNIKTIHVMAGSLGNVKPDFLRQMQHAMQGRQEAARKDTSWNDILPCASNNRSSGSSSRAAAAAGAGVAGWQIYWPSQETAAKSMSMESIRNNMRAIPPRHWQSIPLAARQQFFTDVIHNPQKSTEEEEEDTYCYPVSHSKVIFSSALRLPPRADDYNLDDDYDHDDYSDDGGDDNDGYDLTACYSMLYVGSHNFSTSAWGLGNVSPKNVELGVVLSTSSREQRREWVRRFPYKLTSSSSGSSNSAGRMATSDTNGNYVPVNGWEDMNSNAAAAAADT